MKPIEAEYSYFIDEFSEEEQENVSIEKKQNCVLIDVLSKTYHRGDYKETVFFGLVAIEEDDHYRMDVQMIDNIKVSKKNIRNYVSSHYAD